MPALNLRYCPDGEISEKIVRFYARRAAGGVGLIIVGKCFVEDDVYGDSIGLGNDRYIPGLQWLTGVLHEGGTKVAAQLGHDGGNTHAQFTKTQPVAPSELLYGREKARALSRDEIKELIYLFGQAAVRAKKAGFDAVEVMGSAGNLISQFLSPVTNFRTDEYGGSYTNRMRFGMEVALEVKKQAGQDYPLIYRISGHDFVPGGNTNREAVEFCQNLESAGVDLFNVTGGWHTSLVPQITMQVPPGTMVYLAQGVKQAVRVPVVACNRITTPELAEKIVSGGSADFVGLGRMLMADPDWPLKAQTNRSREIRPCVACNQGCMDQTFRQSPAGCLMNPEVGYEAATSRPAQVAKRVLVIGGGPAGLETARVAAQRGHAVTLWEKEGALGGQLNLAKLVPGRSDWGALIKYYEHVLSLLNVEVKLNQAVTAADLDTAVFDTVVVATGATPAIPPIPGVERAVMAWDVLGGKVPAGDKVVIIGAGATGCDTGLYLSQQGTISPDSLAFFIRNGGESFETLKKCITKGPKVITIVEGGSKAGSSIGLSTRWVVLNELKYADINVMTNVEVIGITEDSVAYVHDGGQKYLPADTVILAAGVYPRNELLETLKDKTNIANVYAAGDVVRPATVLEAIRTGYRVGNEIA